MKKSYLLIGFFILFAGAAKTQNVGIGTTTPAAKLHVLSTVSNSMRIEGPASMFISLYESGQPRGYIGSFAGNAEDVDFGTYISNATGKVHLTTANFPRLTVNSSGNIGIGTTSPNSSALLELKSYTKGLLLPTMTAAGRNAISNPAKGLMVYDSTNNTHYYYNGTAWRPIGSSRYNTDSSLNIGNQVNPVQSFNINSSASTADTTGYLYDNGGPGGNYSDNRNDLFYINSTGESGIIIEIFQMNTESPYDSLSIDFSNQHYAYWGNVTDTLVLDNMNQNILIRFKSNSVNTAAGFGLKWKKIMPGSNPASGYDNGQLSGWYFNDAKLYMRGGYNSNNNWHPDSSGNFSFGFGKNVKAKGNGAVALGIDNIASGEYSTAIGTSTKAIGFNSTAMGNSTTASEEYSTAMGRSTTASGFISTAMGRSTTASGYISTAMGYSSIASGYYSTVMGYRTKASGYSSTAMGEYTTASGGFSIAMGEYTTASGSHSTAMGEYTTASGYASTAMGDASIAKGYASTVLGMFNDSILTSDQYTVTSNTPLFIVGNGDDNTSRSNALVVRKDGIVQVKNNLTVQNGKGIIRGIDGTQRKMQVKILNINTSFAAGETKSFAFNWNETFSSAPDAYVGAVAPGSSSGWAEVIMTVAADNATGGTLFVFNPKSSSVSPNFNIKIIGIGPQ